MEKLVVILMVLAVGVSSGYFLGQDNKVEEAVEEVIKDKTGVDIDLTPKSKDPQSSDGEDFEKIVTSKGM